MKCFAKVLVQCVVFESFLEAEVLHNNIKNMFRQLHNIRSHALKFINHFLYFIFDEYFLTITKEPFDFLDAFFLLTIYHIDLKELNNFKRPLIRFIHCQLFIATFPSNKIRILTLKLK